MPEFDGRGAEMVTDLRVSEFEGPWPAYRPRQEVVAKRLARPAWIDGQFFRDGYLVRKETGRIVVMNVAAFEAIYEPADERPSA